MSRPSCSLFTEMKVILVVLLLTQLELFVRCGSRELGCREVELMEQMPLNLSRYMNGTHEVLDIELGVRPRANNSIWNLNFTFNREDDQIAFVRIYHRTENVGENNTLEIQCFNNTPARTIISWSDGHSFGISRFFKLQITSNQQLLVHDTTGDQVEKLLSEFCEVDLGAINLTVESTPPGQLILILSCVSDVSSICKSWKCIITTASLVSVLLVSAGVVWIVSRRRIAKILSHKRLTMAEYSHEETGQNAPLQEEPQPPKPQQRKPVPSPRTVFLHRRERAADALSTSSISSKFSFGSTTTMPSSVVLPATVPSVPTSPSFSVGSVGTLPEFSLNSPNLDTHEVTTGTHSCQVSPVPQPDTPPAEAATLRHASTLQQQHTGDSEEHVYERATYLFDI
nr:uncharacterized protein LOC123756457 isoform X1 [Procambarus clarkii]